MKAETIYKDLFGTASADIADGTTHDNTLEQLAEYFNVDKSKYKAIGISINGIGFFNISFICIDKNKSTNEKEHLVKIRIKDNQDTLITLFKRLNIFLFNRPFEKYTEIEYDEEFSL